jgi:hypothetical protein
LIEDSREIGWKIEQSLLFSPKPPTGIQNAENGWRGCCAALQKQPNIGILQTMNVKGLDFSGGANGWKLEKHT